MAHPDLNLLFDTVLSFAKLMLSEHGEFYPFGATMSLDGEITDVGASVEGTHHPASQTLIELMTAEFQQRAATGQIRAAAICYDVRTAPPGEADKTDAVLCGLEHCSGESVDVFVPYKKAVSDFQYGEVFSSRRTATFFRKRLV